jgi:predicted alpha/beta superfamily hydrolase
LNSRLVGREYELAVWLPEDYDSSQRRFPVIYLLDGDAFFGMAASLAPALNVLDNIPESIIVGINYDIRSFQEFLYLRELDYKIPEVQDAPPNSHADLFLAALKQEIIPFIETNYHADPNKRIIYGYSSSGFFVLYALCNEPDLFRSYLAGSGDLDLSYPYIIAHDKKLVSREKINPIDIYLSVGGLENGSTQSSVSSFNKLVNAIKAKNYPGIKMITEIYESEKHGPAGAALTYINGLRKCFPTMEEVGNRSFLSLFPSPKQSPAIPRNQTII